MSDFSPDIQRRGTLGLIALSAPVLSVVGVGLAYLFVFWRGSQGIAAAGPLVRIDLDTCAEARPVLQARLAFMGLPDVTVTDRTGGLSVTARLPDQERVREQIPATLAAPGRLVVRGEPGDAVIITEADVTEATVTLPFLDSPKAWIQFNDAAAARWKQHGEAHPGDAVAFTLDGVRAGMRKNHPPGDTTSLILDLADQSDLARLDFAAHAAAVLESGPLPCAATVAGVTDIDG